MQAAEALAYAHHQKVLHRDIKPSNLLLDLQGTVWVTDFGLAKAEGTDALTQAGDIVGTLRYMAPERFQGQADARSDVYALGLTLYEMLTLEPAFAADERARLIDKILHEEPSKPRQLDPRIPRDLETIALKAIAKEPSDRYPTASELAEDLRRYLADRPILARRASALEQARRWCRRNPLVAASLATVAAALVAVAVLALLYADRQRHFGLEQTKATRENHRSGGRPHDIAGRIEPPAGDAQLRPRPGGLREGADRPGPALDDRELASGGRGRRPRLAARCPGQPVRLAALSPPTQGGPLPPESRRGRGLQPRRQDHRHRR